MDIAKANMYAKALLQEINLRFPDKVIDIEQWDHERWDRPLKAICIALGYRSAREFLEERGFSFAKTHSGSKTYQENSDAKVLTKRQRQNRQSKTKLLYCLIAIIVFFTVTASFLGGWLLFHKSTINGSTLVHSEESKIVDMPEQGIRYVDGEIAIFAAPGINRNTVSGLIKPYEGRIIGEIKDIGLYQIFIENVDYEKLCLIVNELNAKSSIEYAEINYVSESNETFTSGTSNINGYNWGLEDINASYIREYKDQMEDVNLGIIDSEIIADHIFGPIKYIRAYYNKVLGVFDSSAESHGTHVAGIAAADYHSSSSTVGVACNAQITNVVMSDHSIKESVTDYIDILYSLLTSNVKVINISRNTGRDLCGGASYGNRKCISTISKEAHMCEIALKRLINQDYEFVICVAAGNENEKNFYKWYSFLEKDYKYSLNKPMQETIVNEFGASFNYDFVSGLIEAKYNHFLNAIDDEEVKSRIIVVGAYDIDDNQKRNLCSFSNVGDRVDVVAPGAHIYSTIGNNNYITLDGTSMATPFVSGTAVALFGLNPELTGAQIKQIIVNSATEYVYCYPKLDCLAAIQYVIGGGGDGRETQGFNTVTENTNSTTESVGEVLDLQEQSPEYTNTDDAPDIDMAQEPETTMPRFNEMSVWIKEGSGAVNIRSGPGTYYDIVGQLQEGSSAVIYEIDSSSGTDWGKTGAGWICMDYVTFDMQVISNASNVLSLFEGHWGDRIGQRCFMDAELRGDKLYVELKWSSGASSTTFWEFVCTPVVGGYYAEYQDGICYTMDSSDGNSRKIVNYTNGFGYFQMDSGEIYWVDAIENQGEKCIFEKIN